MAEFTAYDFREPTMVTGGTKDYRLNKTLSDIANGVPGYPLTWSGPGAEDFARLMNQSAALPPAVVAAVGSDFASQYEAFKKTINEWVLGNNASAKWALDNGIIARDGDGFSWTDPATWPAAIWNAFKPYMVAIGLVLLAVLLIGTGFWKAIK